MTKPTRSGAAMLESEGFSVVHRCISQSLGQKRDGSNLPLRDVLGELAHECSSEQIERIFDAADGEQDRCGGRAPNQQYLRSTMANVVAGSRAPSQRVDISRERTSPPRARPASRWQADIVQVSDIIAGRVRRPGQPSAPTTEEVSHEPEVPQIQAAAHPPSGGSVSYRDIVAGRVRPPAPTPR